MSHYTTELQYIVNSPYMNIGLQDYPLYVFKHAFTNGYNFGKDYKGNQITNFRDYLNNMIIKHYYFREIGFETATRFIWKLNQVMSEIMIYYNQIFESVDQEFNPLWNVDITETYTREIEDNGSGENNTEENGEAESNTDTNSKEDIDNDVTSTGNSTNTKTPNLTNEQIDAIGSPAQNGQNVDEIRAHNFLKETQHHLNYQTGTENENSSNLGNEKTEGETRIEGSSNTNQTNKNTTDSTFSNKNNRNENFTRKEYGSTAGFHIPIGLKQWRSSMINSVMMVVEDDKIAELFINVW